jgi:sugar lactone lactonase YvrE
VCSYGAAHTFGFENNLTFSREGKELVMNSALTTATRVSAPRFALSESPVWDARNGCFVFVDINAAKAFKFNVPGGQLTEFADVSGEGAAWKHLCAVIPRKLGGYVAIGTQGICVMDSSGVLIKSTYLELQTDPRIRFNDVQCIGARLLGGTIDCETFSEPIAAFGEITPNGFRVIEDGHVINNGLAVGPDNHTLYLIESTEPFVWKYDHDVITDQFYNRRPAFSIIDGLDFFKERDAAGAPKALGDGMAAASLNGKFVLCIAEWGLSRIGIYDPATKQWLGKIHVPVTRPTSLAFGGDGLKTIFITSERLPHDTQDNCGVFIAEVKGLAGFASSPVDWP